MKKIEKMTNSPDVLYSIGLIKAEIITILLTAFGRPNITSKTTWVFLAGVLGYTLFLERRLQLAWQFAREKMKLSQRAASS